jgi:hypothetical protein
MIADIQPLATGITLASGIALVRHDFNHSIIFHENFKPAVLGTQYTSCFVPLAHMVGSLQEFKLVFLNTPLALVIVI